MYDPLGLYLESVNSHKRRAMVKHKGHKVLARFNRFHELYNGVTNSLFSQPKRGLSSDARLALILTRAAPQIASVVQADAAAKRAKRHADLMASGWPDVDGGVSVNDASYGRVYARVRGGRVWYRVMSRYRISGTKYFVVVLNNGDETIRVRETNLAEIRANPPVEKLAKGRVFYYKRKKSAWDDSGKHAPTCMCKSCRKPGVSYGSGDLVPKS